MEDKKIDFRLYLITDRKLTEDLFWVVEEALKAGVKALQVREKDLSSRELVNLSERLYEIARRYKAMVFINDRIDIAISMGLDGVHLGVNSIPVDVVRKKWGRELLIGVSTHSLEEALEAQAGGADFITFGPVYETPSKIKYGPPKGIEALKEVCSRVSIPVFAIGGININNTREVLDAGAYGVALISAIMASKTPGLTAGAIIEEIQRRIP